MSGIRDTATVTLNVNGAQAKQMMADIEAKIKQTEATIESLKKSMADPKDIEKAKKQLKTYQKQLDEMRSATEGVNRALENIELATPRELEKALRTLNRQLKDMVPGSDVWDSHVEKIRELKARLADLRDEVGEQETLWGKFKGWATDVWPSIDLLSRGYDAVVGGLREYVDAYANMDQEMANVRKFTGMTEEQVASLNEQFKEMDTRTSREELNKLAQEAGRLGKTSEEDVLGFVRAADKINIALDDLGEGATLQLSKLTGIFGDEAKYGTERSLLKAGSVINELSQICSASAPYLSNFAERMGGVGAQANMTIAQIMGFGAVLDSNGQKVEASATALSQVIVRLYQDPAKYAKVAGLDAQEFGRLMREDANAALILFLETLQKAGGMDQLSPMFKDMGENGSRAIAALSTLATHIDDVKAQQEAANIAFQEGTSIDKEFDVQNNTVAASLDKCKNAANDLRVELGEHLYPIMSHFLTTSSAIMRCLLTTIRYMVEHKDTVIVLTSALVAYITITQLHALWLDRIAIKTLLVNKATQALTFTQKALSGLWASLKLGATALANGFLYLKNGLAVTYSMQERWRKSMQAMSFASWTGLILAVASAIYLLYQRSKKLAEEMTVVDKIRKEAISKMGEEKYKIDLLVAAAKNEKLSLDERQKAIVKLNSIIPDYNAQLDNTTGKYKANKKALDDYLTSLTRKYELEGAKEKLAELGREKATATIELNEAQSNYDRINSQTNGANGYTYITQYGTSGNTGIDAKAEAERRLNKANKKKAAVEAKEQRVLSAYGVDLQKDAVNNAPEEESEDNGGNGDYDPDPTSKPARFAKEDAWKEREEATARIDYARGESTYEEHTNKMNQIAVDYYQMLLDRADVSGDEELSIKAKYWEAIQKRDEDANKISLKLTEDARNKKIEDENKSYDETIYKLNESLRLRLSVENLSAIERENAEKVHQEAVELAELNHLARLVDMYEEGSAERLRAQQAYQSAQLKAQHRHQQEYEKQEAEYAKIKADVFGDNPQEKQQKYDTAFAALKTVYERELAAAGDNAAEKLRIEEAFLQAQNALRRQYGLESEEDTRNAMERGVAASVEWLNGDGGKALTGTLSTLTQGMSSIFSGLSTLMQAELEIQTAAITKRYDREIQFAQGNSYKVAKLEKKKEAEIAKAKNEANKKMFAMQVIQAVAQTAQNALSAYGSAAAVPVVGYILAPIAAAMAVAAGAIQIAAIKKQQQASEAQGYSQGGFTKPGAVNEPAGIVHAGEWVASQKLLANPVARPMIEALDYAQRTNTIGSLRADDVSRSITANNSLVRIAESDNGTLVMAAVASRMSNAVSDLTDRLNEPFVTVNTVTGSYGMQKAQDDYSRLMSNVTPKSKRKKI